MSVSAELAALVRELIESSWPGRFGPDELDDNASLGKDGLGLDSVEIVELLFACEESCGRRANEQLLKTEPLTIARVADHFALADA